jgi:lipopolysaccharide export system permease protein
MSGGQSIKTSDGIWYRDNNDFIFIKEIAANNELRNIARYRVNTKMQLILTSFAEKGHYENGQWLFYNINQTNIENNNHIVSKKIAKQSWGITLDKNLLGLTKLTPDQMSLNKLKAYLQFRHHNGLTAGLYEFEFWKRLIQPIATMVMIFLAIPFIFGPLRSSSMGFRIVAGVIVGFSFYVMNQFFGPLSLVCQIPAFISALLPTLLFALIGGFLLFLKS